MILKTALAILGLSLAYLSFTQVSKPEGLIGKWESKQGKDIQIWTFTDASHMLIYNNIHAAVQADTLNERYRIEKITASGFELILYSDSDYDKDHEGKSNCRWLNANQFRIESVIALPEFTFVFTRTK
jgi:hypothetical protein